LHDIFIAMLMIQIAMRKNMGKDTKSFKKINIKQYLLSFYVSNKNQ